jgi:protein TonB
MRVALALTLALVVVLGLFWLMHFLVLGSDPTMKQTESYRTVDFVRLQREPELETRQRVRPERPPPPDRPPPPPEMQVQAPTPQQPSPTPFSIPSLNLPTQVSGGPFIGSFSPDQAGISDGELVPLVRLAPQYPRNAARDGVSGEVRLEVVVNPDGTVKSARVLEARPRGYFEAAAVSAARRGRFRPRVVDGQPVESVGTYTMQFTLDD